MTACEPERPCDNGRLEPITRPVGVAVVFSDYTSTAIGLLDSEGELLTESWIDSGTTPSGVSTTLSGDVVLPTTSVLPRTLTWIDRLGVDVITQIGFERPLTVKQFNVQLPTQQGQSAYRANPQDARALPDGGLLVTRHEPNLAPNAPSIDQGDDLVMVAPDNTITRRIDLAQFSTTFEDTLIYARPTQIATLGRTWVVGTARLSADFRQAAAGAVALVDHQTYAVSAQMLEGLANCGEVREAPNDTTTVFVLCAGGTFGIEQTRRSTAGIVRLQLDAQGAPQVTKVWRASEHADAPSPSSALLALNATHVLAVANGDDAANQGDQLVAYNVETGTHQITFQAHENFVLGRGTYNPVTGLLFVPDAQRGVLRWRVTTELSFEERSAVAATTCHRLPALHAGSLAP